MNKIWKYYAHIKPDTKWHILYDFTYKRYLNQSNSESRIVVTKSWGVGRNGELLFNGYRVSVWDDEKLLEMDSGHSCQQCEGT